MKIAVLTFTRDRLDYTRHCFATLEDNTRTSYDHFVLDQASEDDTWTWLWDWAKEDFSVRVIKRSDENIGICRGANQLLEIVDPENYDVVVRFDNDCEVTQPGTLKACAELAMDYGTIVAPRVLGLQNPPATIRTVKVGHQYLDETAILGGIFMAIPAFLFTDHGFRWNENTPLGTGDESIVPWWRAHGGICGYLQGYTVNHYETTVGQHERYPDYFARTEREALV